MTTILLTTVVIALVMAVMALGVMISGRCLRPSCGGPDAVRSDDEELTCSTCGRTKKQNASSDKKTMPS